MDAATNGQLDVFRDQIDHDAQSTLGTPEAMAAIRRRLARYVNVSVGDAVPATSADPDRAHPISVQRSYEAPVTGAPRKRAPAELIYTLRLQCTLSDRAHNEAAAENCPTMIERTDVPWMNCTPGAPVDEAAPSEACVLTGIEAARDH